ncbi:3-deoxy-7-phosphoheptulonate synthase [Streptomyces olivaceus]|uniref:3-deoxy-7-phosphoheptulonate synthase n=1 Tax=Streptomyces olivaceus TaxID=47716 RepID=UPI0040576A03
MIVAMDRFCGPDEIEHVEQVMAGTDVQAVRTVLEGRTHLITAEGDRRALASRLRLLPGVASVVEPPGNLRLSSRAHRAQDTVVKVSDVSVGGDPFVVVAGPCAVESRDQLAATARFVALGGAAVLRGGSYKPRTSPYSFQGLGREGLSLLAEQRAATGLPVVTEVVDPADLTHVAEVADMVQIGTRNAQNYTLLREAGRAGKPVLLKRGMASTVEEWLLAAEYVLAEGNPDVVLCERGIRSFEPSTRFTLDLSAVVVAKRLSHLPVLVDPSHAAGQAELVRPLALAAAAVGADGVMVDVHPEPSTALCDAGQALTPAGFDELVTALDSLLAGMRRPLAGSLRPRGALVADRL